MASLRKCCECDAAIPEHKRPEAIYCSSTCRATAEKRRSRDRRGISKNPRRGPYQVTRKEYEGKAEALRLRSRKRYHLETYGRELDTEEDVMLFAKDRYKKARLEGYRSGLEVKLARQLEEAGVAFEYETKKISYIVPERKATYTPDIILPNGIIIEAKGRFETQDRQKMVLVKKQHPDLDIRFVFSRASSPIYKGSKTTYAKWAEDHGFIWAEKRIPQEWIRFRRTP